MDDHVARVTDALTAARQHRETFHDAIVELERAAAAPAPGREEAWSERVGDALAGLRTALAEHQVVTEGPAGLYDEICAEQPRFDHRTRELAADHQVLAELLDAASAVLASESKPGAATVEATREALTTLVARLFRHRQRGLDLVYEAYMTDIGGSD
jgi:hypothetical protein